MRIASWLLAALTACSGPSTAQPARPSNPALPPSTTAPEVGLGQEVCAQRADELGHVPLRADQVALRRGTGAKTLAEAPSTRAAPIEVCMPRGQRAWLGSVTCADGTPPSASARSGNVGPGGTCGSVIDLYVVTCPEQAYEVFMDMYMCPPGEGL